MKLTRTAGGVVINEHTGRVLVVSQNGDSWSLPKGHLEPGEDDLEAAEREIEEESGIARLTFVRELGSYERHAIGYGGQGERTDEMKTIVMFLFTTSQDDLKPVDPKNPEARWLPREEVAGLLTHAKDKEFFLGVLPSLG
jgi:8-oxo-dGTP pyrophosphatase MutT (NUDIX family)